MSGVTVNDEVTEKYNEIKMKKALRYVIFKIENFKEVVFDCEGPKTETYQDFLEKLGDEPRYALVDFDYTSADGRPQSKICFVFWSPDGKASVKQRMVYASSKDAIAKKLTGIMKTIQANDKSDLDEASLKADMSK